jgi:hypothetical protein
MMDTGPAPSFGITTAVLGVKLVEDVVWIVQKESGENGPPLVWLVVHRVIVAGPTTIGRFVTAPFSPPGL